MAEASSPSVQNWRLKLQKHSNETNVDRISNLPDELLCQILSFLTTNDAVGTSLLSSRWRYVWTCVPILRFEENSAVVRDEFVDRVMTLHRLPCIKKFYLMLSKHHDPSHVNKWICAAVLRNVEELHLFMEFGFTMKVPQIPFNCCEKLMVLKLGGLVLDVPTSVCFPCLKILHLDHVSHLTSRYVEKILSGSPVLEDLSICDDNLVSYMNSDLFICSLSLKKLALCNLSFGLYSLDVVTPKLEVLKLKGLWCSNYNMKNLSSLIEADIDFCRSFAAKLQRQISNVKDFSKHDFVSFGKLTHLDVTLRGNGWLILHTMLKCSPNLEVLVIDMLRCDKEILRLSSEDVLRCMSCIERFELKEFTGCQKGMELVEYLLKNSTVLKKMIISQSWNWISVDFTKRWNNVVKRLLMFPRASSGCQIIFP